MFTIPEPSTALSLGFIGLVAVTVLAALVGVRRTVASAASIQTRTVASGMGLWLAATAGVALVGITANFESTPPPLMGLVLVGFLGTGVLASGRLGSQVAAGISTAGLIVFQGFRLPLELLMHRAYTEGLMPVQMSFEGRNLDILTGAAATAIGGVFLLRRRAVPRGLAWAFNLGGLALLLNIVVVAIASLPTFAAFGSGHLNVWVGDFPFVWLPTIFVMLALFGHLVLTRRLLAERRVARDA